MCRRRCKRIEEIHTTALYLTNLHRRYSAVKVAVPVRRAVLRRERRMVTRISAMAAVWAIHLKCHVVFRFDKDASRTPCPSLQNERRGKKGPPDVPINAEAAAVGTNLVDGDCVNIRDDGPHRICDGRVRQVHRDCQRRGEYRPQAKVSALLGVRGQGTCGARESTARVGADSDLRRGGDRGRGSTAHAIRGTHCRTMSMSGYAQHVGPLSPPLA